MSQHNCQTCSYVIYSLKKQPSVYFLCWFGRYSVWGVGEVLMEKQDLFPEVMPSISWRVKCQQVYPGVYNARKQSITSHPDEG